ncbi:MAG: SapC family protein [Caulobacteraceae bacterium]|nr:SapC family protein [Caulobacteraceae bacterium]
MTEPTPSETNPVTGAVLFYSKPEPLSSEMHGRIGLRRVDRPFDFAAGSQISPLTVTEFPSAALCYPIIFAGEKRQPLAVMGVADGDNLFITKGMFEIGAYIPAYIRRYPFVLANDQANEKLVVCVDRAAAMVGDLPDLPFFTPDGQPSDYTRNCIKFCDDYETETRRTESFVALLQELDLLESRTQTHSPLNPDGTIGAPQDVAQFFAVSEERLKALPAAKLKELIDNGALAQIHAHLISLLGWDRLIAITLARRNAPPAAANLN